MVAGVSIMQAVDPAGLVPGGSHSIPEAEGGLFEARLAAAFSDESAGEAPADQPALDEATDASGVPLAPGQVRAEAMAAALPQLAPAHDARATGLSPIGPVPDGGDEVDDGVGGLAAGEWGSAPPRSTDVRMLTANTGAEPASKQGQGARDREGTFDGQSRPRDGDLTAAASPMSGRRSGGDPAEGRAHTSGRDASAVPADTSSGASRAVFRHATVVPSAEAQTATEPAAPVTPTERFPAEPRPAAHAGAAPLATDVAAGARTRSPETRPDPPMAAPAAAPVLVPPSGAPTQESFDGDMQRGPGHEPSAAPPPPAPRASSSPVPMLFQSGEGLPAAAATAPGTAAVASYALMASQDRAENIGRLVQSMRVLVRDGVSEATVRLRPEHLGDVNIALRVDGRSVSAVVRAEAAGVREWLQSQHESLRQGLALQGLSLDRLEVEPDGRRDEREGRADEEDRPRRPQPRAVDAESRFEVVV